MFAIAVEVRIRKISPYQCIYNLLRDDNTTDTITLDVKTYLLHDVTHFVVESSLNITEGFWGMLAAGYGFKDLSGNNNELTPGLREIEKIVGPVQSAYMGYIKTEDFSIYTFHLAFKLEPAWLNSCILQITVVMQNWETLKNGEDMLLVWPLPK